MKRTDDDKLRDIFLEIKTGQPSAGFEDKLMQQIQIVAAKKRKKKIQLRTIYNTCALIGGSTAIIVLPFILFNFFGIEMDFALPEINYSAKMPAVNIDPMWILICSSALLLLIADVLIRRYIKNKKYHNL